MEVSLVFYYIFFDLFKNSMIGVKIKGVIERKSRCPYFRQEGFFYRKNFEITRMAGMIRYLLSLMTRKP